MIMRTSFLPFVLTTRESKPEGIELLTLLQDQVPGSGFSQPFVCSVQGTCENIFSTVCLVDLTD